MRNLTRMELKDRVAIVTGGGSGIGEALARRFVQEGARFVVIADRDTANAERVAADIGARATAATLDVADEAATRALVEQVEVERGPIDLFVANAGYGNAGGIEFSNDDFQRMWEVHVMARICRPGGVAIHDLPWRGLLLTTASAAGLLTQMDSVIYALTKHAAVALAEWLAINHYHQGIRVSTICPQAVRTNIMGNRPSNSSRQASSDGVLEPAQLADTVIEALRAERLWVLPHPEVATYAQRRAEDVDRWLGGMRRFQDRIFGDLPRPGDWLVQN